MGIRPGTVNMDSSINLEKNRELLQNLSRMYYDQRVLFLHLLDEQKAWVPLKIVV
jgi:hypothetical protein